MCAPGQWCSPCHLSVHSPCNTLNPQSSALSHFPISLFSTSIHCACVARHLQVAAFGAAAGRSLIFMRTPPACVSGTLASSCDGSPGTTAATAVMGGARCPVCVGQPATEDRSGDCTGTGIQTQPASLCLLIVPVVALHLVCIA